MSVKRDEDMHYSFSCDERDCQKMFDASLPQNFSGAWKLAHLNGWSKVHRIDRFLHYCPEHKKESKR